MWAGLRGASKSKNNKRVASDTRELDRGAGHATSIP
jgi:hypothetical protein